jgi:hypothetical protein
MSTGAHAGVCSPPGSVYHCTIAHVHVLSSFVILTFKVDPLSRLCIRFSALQSCIDWDRRATRDARRKFATAN